MADGPKKRVMIVDDDSLILSMYSLKFQKEGLDVQSFTTGEEFLAKLKEDDKVDLLIIDLVIPVMSGFDILEQVRNQNLAKDAKVIVLTNQNEEQDIKRATELKTDMYIVKATTIPSDVVKKAIEVMNK